MLDCPHCYVRVLASADGSCPSCGEDTRRPGVGPQRALLALLADEPLPERCLQCGHPTDRTTFVKYRREAEGDSAPSWFVALLMSALALMVGYIFFWLRTKASSHLEFRLPQCEDCRRTQGSPQAQHVDFPGHRASFIVSQAFRQELRSARQARLR